MDIRAMTPADLGFAMEVKRAAGWNQTEADWRAHLALDRDGCLVAELEGRRAGTAVLADYDGRFGWIAMVLVHPEHRRRGAGTALVRAARDRARDRGLAQVRLDASPAGREVYLTLGFADQYELTRYRRPADEPVIAARAGAGTGRYRTRRVHAGETGPVGAVLGWDADRFGAHRGRVLRELLTRPGSRLFGVHRDGALAGFVITRLGEQAVQLGPWLAVDDGAAEVLLRAALAEAGSTGVIMDVPVPNAGARALAEHYGFVVERPFTRMSWPAAPAPEDNRRIYASAGADRG
jgi:GNAT superfamily N-acetyltransferase